MLMGRLCRLDVVLMTSLLRRCQARCYAKYKARARERTHRQPKVHRSPHSNEEKANLLEMGAG